MSFIRDAIRLFAVGSLVLLCGCAAEPNEVATRWLRHDCTVGERGQLEIQLRSEGVGAQGTLLAAYTEGPPSEDRDELAIEAALQYDEVMNALNAGRTYGLSAAEIAFFRAITKAEHVQRTIDEFDGAYRSQALSGLAVLNLPRGRETLHRIASDPGSPDREIARLAIRHFGVPPASP